MVEFENGTPSTIIKGLLSPVILEKPLMVMLVPLPAIPLPPRMFTPATWPDSALATSV